ncbi:MAG: hypothetical protein WDN26_05770 [Chitinophagaceae bacterium]
MKSLLKYALVAVGLMMTFITSAQSDSIKKTNVQFKIGAYYNSNLNYFGRTDSLRSSGFFPMAELWINKHFYINAAPVFVNNTAASFQYAGTVATAGYQFNDQKRWAGNFYVVKPIYKDNSELVQSALKAQVAASLTLQNKIINITGGADVKFSGNTDFGATGGLDHIFRFQLDDKTVLVIDPSSYVYAGTQQFTNTYYKKSSFLLFPGVEQQVSENVKKFNILSYELSVPVILGMGKFQLLAIPSYVMPQNLITVPNRPDLSERGENLFYATLGAKVTF